MDKLKIAVLVSGSGTNLQALIDAVDAGELDVDIVRVVSSNTKAYGIERAKSAGISTLVFRVEDYEDPEAVDRVIVRVLTEDGVEYLAMAGYMRKVTPVLLDAFPNRIVNLHPALLPKHPGAHGIQDAYDAHDEETGITFHFANEEYDQGPIIFQHALKIHWPNETVDELETRIHAAEHEYYPQVMQWIAEGRVHVEGTTCHIDE